MMSRSSSVILVVTSLAAGLVLGFSLGRGGPVVSAQVGGSLRGQAGSMTSERAARRAAQVSRQDSQIYDQLAKEYEQFAHVDRMFELVSKAVSPSVVHIVAQKTVRHEESQRIKKFEETGSGVIVRNDKNPGLYVLTNHHVVEGGKIANIRIFLHDGRATPANGGLLHAIQQHASEGSEANAVINNFNSLSDSQKQDLLNFLRSL